MVLRQMSVIGLRKGRLPLPGVVIRVEAIKLAVPTIHPTREFVEAGGLLSYGPSLFALGERAAWYVDRILRGTKPADLPVEQPTRFELALNMKTAKTLGLQISPSLIGTADEVIE
jgi:putative ABC transport system substrate-binding protein